MLGRRGDRGGRHPRQDHDDRDDLAHVLTGCGLDPSFVIGGALTGASTGGHLGGGDVFVVEADESDGSFLQYPAEIAVVTNVDPDHLGNWGTAENYADGFLRFATGERVRLLVVSADDPGAVALTERVRRRRRPGRRRSSPSASARAPTSDHRRDLRRHGFAFELRQAGSGGPVTWRCPATTTCWNAAATYAVAHLAGRRRGGRARRAVRVRRHLPAVPADRHGRRHPGLRRLRPPPDRGANTLIAARTGVGDGRVVVCFQPHLYTRTRDFWRELAAALELADEAIVMDVCGDREDPIARHRRRAGRRGGPPGTAHVTYEPDWDAAAADGGRDRPARRPGDHGRLRRRDQGGAADRRRAGAPRRPEAGGA